MECKKKDKDSSSDFPGGPVDENPPANAGNTGSIPGTGRSHPPQDDETHTAPLLSLPLRARAPHREKPQPRSLHTSTRGASPAAAGGDPRAAGKTRHSQERDCGFLSHRGLFKKKTSKPKARARRQRTDGRLPEATGAGWRN